jgi:hypothetical protein
MEQKTNQATTKDHIGFLNVIVSSIGAIFLWFICYALFLGTEEDFIQLKENLPISFLTRFGMASIIGLIGVGCLSLINILLNYTVLRNKSRLNLVRIALIDSAIVLFGSLLGTAMFFCC